MIAFPLATIRKIHGRTSALPRPLNESLAIMPNPVDEIGNRLSSNLRASAVEHTFYLRVEGNAPIDKPGPGVKFFHSIVPSLHYLVDGCRTILRVIAEPEWQGCWIPAGRTLLNEVNENWFRVELAER